MCLLRHIGTNYACTQACIPVSTMLQHNVMELRKLLLTVYQFSSVRIPMEYVVVFTRCSNISFVAAGLWSLSG